MTFARGGSRSQLYTVPYFHLTYQLNTFNIHLNSKQLFVSTKKSIYINPRIRGTWYAFGRLVT